MRCRICDYSDSAPSLSNPFETEYNSVNDDGICETCAESSDDALFEFDPQESEDPP